MGSKSKLLTVAIAVNKWQLYIMLVSLRLLFISYLFKDTILYVLDVFFGRKNYFMSIDLTGA